MSNVRGRHTTVTIRMVQIFTNIVRNKRIQTGTQSSMTKPKDLFPRYTSKQKYASQFFNKDSR